MIRSALGKVAWVGRTASMVFGLALVLALVVGVASTAFGANGQNFILGKFNNAATKVTGLVGNVDGAAALRVTNPNTGTNDTALDLRVQAGEAPMRVNTAKKVANLNADRIDDREASSFANGVGGVATNSDKLDNKDSSEFLGKTEKAADSDKLDGFDASELLRGASATGIVNTSTSPKTATLLTASAPRQGGLLVNLDFACSSFSGTTDTRWDISLSIDGAKKGISGSVVFPHAALASPGDSTSVTAFVPVEAGDHAIGYNAARSSGDGSLDCNINVSSLFVPFGNSGVAPASAQALSQPMSESGGAQQ